MIRVENINTVMSLACFQSFSRLFNTSVRVASQVLDCFFFFVLVVLLSREIRVQLLSQFWASSFVSTSVEHVSQKRGTLLLSISLSVQIRYRTHPES